MVNVSKGFIVRYIAWFSLIVLLSLLFIDALGEPLDLSDMGIPQADDVEEGEPNLILGIILLTTGVMILIETVFTRDLGLANWRNLNFFLGIPSGVVAIAMGISWIFGFEFVIQLLTPMLDGVYLSGLIILTYEGMISLTGRDQVC